MNDPNEPEIRRLHKGYCDLVGELPLTLDRIYWWGQWLKNGWTCVELRLVVEHLQRGIKDGRRFPGSLRWSRLIQDAENFGEELILAKAEMRNHKKPVSGKERVLKQYERPVGESALTPMTAKSAGDWIAGMEILKRAAQ